MSIPSLLVVPVRWTSQWEVDLRRKSGIGQDGVVGKQRIAIIVIVDWGIAGPGGRGL